jgi:hypothetical protein
MLASGPASRTVRNKPVPRSMPTIWGAAPDDVLVDEERVVVRLG